jgi:hypothetical protein
MAWEELSFLINAKPKKAVKMPHFLYLWNRFARRSNDTFAEEWNFNKNTFCCPLLGNEGFIYLFFWFHPVSV